MTNVESSPTDEKQTMRIVTLRIVPFIMLLYFIAYLDRVNVGFAAITMNRDIGLSDAAFGFGAGVFFLGYFLFELPSNLILHRVGARRWIARIMLSWGLVSAAMAFVETPTAFYILRFLLGVAEAGFFPGIILYLSYWFPRKYKASITALFMTAVPISIALGSPLSGWLLSWDGLGGLHGWQWLFLVEAIPAIALSAAVLLYLTDKPEKANWLNTGQRNWLVNKLKAEQRGLSEEHGLSAVLKALTHPKVLALAIVYFGTSAGLYTLGIWAPQIFSQFNINATEVGFINAIPPVFAIVAMIFWGRHSDRKGERVLHVFFASILAALGLTMAAFAQSLGWVIAALVLVNIGISSAKPPLWAMPTQFLKGQGAAAGIAAINSIGNLGGFFGPFLIGYVKSTTGSYFWGLIGVAVSLVLSAFLVLLTAHKQAVSPVADSHSVTN